ncbi:MAG TPA: aminotransferase [Noviherbaspirillum sp.]|nr:aminotransferase [Noviherbaspirillum sp.]
MQVSDILQNDVSPNPQFLPEGLVVVVNLRSLRALPFWQGEMIRLRAEGRYARSDEVLRTLKPRHLLRFWQAVSERFPTIASALHRRISLKRPCPPLRLSRQEEPSRRWPPPIWVNRRQQITNVRRNQGAASMDDKKSFDTERCQSIVAARHFAPCADQRQVKPEYISVMVRGEGTYLWDSQGKQYLDGVSGVYCTALGYGREELVEAATNQMRQLSFCSPYMNVTHPSLANLAERLFSILPERYGRVVYCNSGSEANETLIRTVRRYWDTIDRPQKKILISRHNAYHGSTMGSASLGGFKAMHQMGGLPIPGIHHIGEPYWFAYRGDLTEEEFGLRMAGELEEKILELGPDNVTAFVAEPIQGAGGFIFPPSTYWPEIQRICRKYDVLLCVDEVIGGFGRMGEWFSHQLYGIEPDTISIAKGLTSGYVPMGGLILSSKIADAIAAGGLYAHVFTYQGHPLAAAVACANLGLLNEGGIVDKVRNDTGPYLQRLLQETFAGHPLVWGVQGAGAAAALQLAPVKGKKQRFANEDVVGAYCTQSAFQTGLIVRSVMARMILAPALTATREEIDGIVQRLKLAVDRTAEALGII